MRKVQTVIAGASALLLLGATAVLTQQNQMTFFATSMGSGMGGNLGGLAGADKQCQTLAKAAGAGGTWRAYSARRGQAPSTRKIGSEKDRGVMQKEPSLRRTSTISTARRPTSQRKRSSPRRVSRSKAVGTRRTSMTC